MSKKERNLNLDLIRAVATVLVLSSHFLTRSALIEEPVLGKRMLVVMAIRYVSVTCVPLFLMLTGYLSGNKKPEWAYFKKLGSTLGVYTLCSLVCMAAYCLFWGKRFYVGIALMRILDFTGSDYAWYVEMYIGLFLLAPFLNVLYHGLPDRKGKLLMLGVLIGITCAWTLTNVFSFTAESAYGVIYDTNYNKLLPQWWELTYPVMYYMIGMYIREYGVKLRLRRIVLLMVLAVAVFSLHNYIRTYGQVFSGSAPWLGRSSVQNLIISVLLFCFLLRLPTARVPLWLRAVIGKISQLSFAVYLLSSATDMVVYYDLGQRVPMVSDRLLWYPAAVGCSFLLACLGARLVLWFHGGCGRLWRRLVPDRKTAAE